MTDDFTPRPPSAPNPDPFHLPVVSGGEAERIVATSAEPVLVDFFATWCGPCAWIIPTLRALAEEFGEGIRVLKVDTDESPELTARLRIGSVPTLVLFEGGEETGRSIGVEPEKVRAMVEGAVARCRG
jgi:thioredoxin 1